jgi:hypothetical protein
MFGRPIFAKHEPSLFTMHVRWSVGKTSHQAQTKDTQDYSYSIIQTLTGGRLQPLDTLTKMSRF